MFEPTNQLSLSWDYFRIRLKETITTGIPIPTILGDLNQYGGLVTRAPTDPNFPNLPGRISSISQTLINLGAVHIEGWDAEAHYRVPRQSWGRLRFDITGTYYTRYDGEALDGSFGGFVSNNFGAIVAGVPPRWKHYASITWDSGPWMATVGQTFQANYIDTQPDADGCWHYVGGSISDTTVLVKMRGATTVQIDKVVYTVWPR